jgi:hypothetical protein
LPFVRPADFLPSAIHTGIALGQKIPWANKLLRDLTRESVTDAG